MTVKIAILEDSDYRIKLFNDLFDTVETVTEDTVMGFLGTVGRTKNTNTIELIILDHDLGHPFLTKNNEMLLAYDESGLCGLDAVTMLPDPREFAHNVLCIVWSANDVGANKMIRQLKHRGFNCMRIPIWEEKRLRDVISKFTK